MKHRLATYVTLISAFSIQMISIGSCDESNQAFKAVKKIAAAIELYQSHNNNKHPATLEKLVPRYLKDDDLWIPNTSSGGLPLIRMVYLNGQDYRLPDNKSIVVTAITSCEDDRGFFLFIDSKCNVQFISRGGYQLLLARQSDVSLTTKPGNKRLKAVEGR